MSGRAMIAGYVAAYRAKGADTRELQRGERFTEVRMGEVLGPAEDNPGGRGNRSDQNGLDRIGELLGPGPGPGARTDLEPPLANGGRLDPDRAYEFRQLAAHRDQVIAWVRAGVLR